MISTAVVVSLSKAVICFSAVCQPALVGIDTPTGHFPMQQVATSEPGYHGDVIVYKENQKYAWAIHRLWLLDPAQHRAQRIESPDPKDRVITMGCINVKNQTYAQLVKWLEANPGAKLIVEK